MLPVLAAAAAAAVAPSEPASVEVIQVTARAPVVGSLQQGTQAYRPEFFTAVRPGTALDMVQWLPGFSFEDVRDVRGLGGAVGNVLIDGQPPTSKNDTLSTVLRRIPANQVERVDIIVGGAPGIDMRGRSVIANVVLKKTTQPRGQLSVQAQVTQDGRVAPELSANISRKTPDRSVEGSLTLSRRLVTGLGVGTGPIVRTDGAGAVVFAGRSVVRGDYPFATGTGAYEFPFAGGKLRANLAFTYADAEASERTDIPGLPALYATDLTEHIGQGELGLRYTRSLGRSTLEIQGLQRINAHESTNLTQRLPVLAQLAENDTLSESVLRGTWRFKRDDTLSLEASAEGAVNGLDTRSDFSVGGVPTRLPAGDTEIGERRADLGGLFTWKPSAVYSLTGALRVETSTLEASRDVSLERTLTYWKPRVLFAWTPSKETQVRLRLEREVGQISFSNFVAQVDVGAGDVRTGNPDLRPRRAWVAEAVVERQFWGGASLVVTGRRSLIDDVVDVARLPQFGGVIGVTNIGDGRQTDLVTTLTLPLKHVGLDNLSFKGTVNARWSKVTDPTTGERRRLSSQSPVVADVHLVHDLPRLKVNWGVDVLYSAAATDWRPTTIERDDDWLRVGAFVERRFGPDWTLRLEAINLNNPRPTWRVKTFAGPRGAAPLLYTDERRNAEGRTVMLRVRKTLS